MPPVIVGAAASAAIGAASGVTFFGLSVAASAAISFAGSLILGGLSYALTPTPKAPKFDTTNLGGSTVAIRQSDLTRQIVYGHTRVTRGYATMQSTGANGKLHMILMLCEGPLRAINEVWLNDYAIPNDWIDANGTVTSGRYAGKLVIRKHLGEDDQAADSLAVSNLDDWDANCRLQGIAYLYLIMTKDQDVYPTGVPNVSAVVEGPAYFDPRAGNPVWSTNMAIHSAAFLSDERFGFAAGDDIDEVNVSAQANICDEMVDTIAKNYTVGSVDTANDRLALNGDLLDLQFGDRVQISSTGSIPGGLSGSTNYYVIPYQIKDNPRILLATSLANAMSKTSIDISSAGSGVITVTKNGEPRYHGSGIVDTEANLSETLNNLVTCMAGRAVNVGGAWTLLAGAWRTPSVSFNESDIRNSGIGVKNALSLSDSYNIVNGLYVSQLNLYQPTDYPAARYETFIEQDNGVEAPKDLNLPFVTRPTTAQRIAKIELFRGRQDIVYKSDFSTKGLQVQPGDVIELDLERLGWEGKEFEITEFAFDVNDGSLLTRMSLRETAQAIYDWTDGEAIDFDPAPNTNLPDVFNVVVPSGVAYNSSIIDTRDGDVLYTLTLNWLQHPDVFVQQFGDFEIQYKRESEDDWRPSFFVDGILTQTDVVNSSVNIAYDLRIRARNNLGVRSAWVSIFGAVVGSSGGVSVTDDWEFVNDTVSIFKDWGGVADAVTSTEDWGFVV